MVGHRGSSAGSYLADPTSPIPSHCASIVATSTVRVNFYKQDIEQSMWTVPAFYIKYESCMIHRIGCFGNGYKSYDIIDVRIDVYFHDVLLYLLCEIATIVTAISVSCLCFLPSLVIK